MDPARQAIRTTLKEYANLGFPVLPIWGVTKGICECGNRECGAIGKHPRGDLAPNGVKNASLNEGIYGNWTQRHKGNWGIATGHKLANSEGFLIVLDVDPRNGGLDSLHQFEERYGSLPHTPTALTGGGGFHYLFWCEEQPANGNIGPGLDIKGYGGYILVEPSMHASGKQYVWDMGCNPNDTPIAKAPQWIAFQKSNGPRPEHNGESARNTILGEAFALAGMLGPTLKDGMIAVRCPWADEHSDARGRGEDGSTAILPPAMGSNFGAFRCLHGHCEHRKWNDVFEALPKEIVAAAKKKYKILNVVKTVPSPEPPPPPKPVEKAELDKFMARLKMGVEPKTGRQYVKDDLINTCEILSGDPRGWRAPDGKGSIIRWDEFTNQYIFTEIPPWHPDDGGPDSNVRGKALMEVDLIRIRKWLERYYDLKIDDKRTMDTVIGVGRANSFHPVRDWLHTLEWDGTPRLQSWLTDYLGVERSEYTSLVGKWWLISAVARAMQPGCKADYVLVLQGKQGIGKSTALNILGGNTWTSDTPFELGTKDAYMAMRGKWIIELAEIEALLVGRESGAAKAFFSSPTDSYRPPYERNVVSIRRSCVFAATTNLEQFLSDTTGNRRYWPVYCFDIDLDKLREVREQLWAEAVVAFKAGERWWPHTTREIALCEEQQSERVEYDAWEHVLENWAAEEECKLLMHTNGYLTTEDIAFKALGFDSTTFTRPVQTRLGRVLANLEWKKVKTAGSGKRRWAYQPHGG